MLITEKYGNLNSSEISNKNIDALRIEWHETGKRILHKTTKSGIGVTLKFLNENPNLKEGDILWQDESSLIAVEIIPVECIVVTSNSVIAVAALCYEIGNRHLPLFSEKNELLIPYNTPLYNLLHSSGYLIRIEERKLDNPFKTTVLPHVQVSGTGSIPTKMPQLSTL